MLKFKKERLTGNQKIEQQFDVLRPFIAVLIALLMAFVVIFLCSKTPLEAIRLLMLGPLTTLRRFGNVIELLIPFVFTGCAICILYSADVINMAAEGSFFLGGVAATWIAVKFTLPYGVHPVIALLIAGIVGAIVCFIPAYLEMKFDAKAVVSSLMLNYVCLYIGLFIINYLLRDPSAGFFASKTLLESATLPKILKGTSVHSGIFIAAITIIFSYLYLFKSKWGYAVRIIGKNKNFAKYSGIGLSITVISSQLIGGFIAGVGGGVQILGMYTRFQYQALPQYGFDGILIAILAKYNPKYVLVSGFLLAYIRTGADIMARTTDVPAEIVKVVQAFIIMMIAAQMFLQNWKHKRIVANSKRELAQYNLQQEGK